MYLRDNLDNLGGHLGRHRHRLALGNLVIKLLVESLRTRVKGSTAKASLLDVLFEVLGAIYGPFFLFPENKRSIFLTGSKELNLTIKVNG